MRAIRANILTPGFRDFRPNLLPAFTGPERRILKVELYNGAPAAEGPAAGRLAELGFVRDYPGMAYYAGWPERTEESNRGLEKM